MMLATIIVTAVREVNVVTDKAFGSGIIYSQKSCRRERGKE